MSGSTLPQIETFLPSSRQNGGPFYRFGSLDVVAADGRTMLAMKIRASRGRRDEPDIALLLVSCGVTTVEQAFALCEKYFPEDPAPSRARPILDCLLPPEK